MIEGLKTVGRIIFHLNNFITFFCIVILYLVLYFTDIGNASFVSNVYNWLQMSSVDLFITQVTSSFLVISITTMLTTKGKMIYWEDTIHYMLINPPRMNLRSISDYCFFDVTISLIAIVCGKNGAVLVSFIFNLFFLICMTYKLLKIYFGKEEIQRELLVSFYTLVSGYKELLDKEFEGYEHVDSIRAGEAKCKLYEGKREVLSELNTLYNEIYAYVEKTKENILEAIMENRIAEVAECMSFLVDFRGYYIVSDYFTRNDSCKEEYLNAFFNLRIKKILALEKYCNDEKEKKNILIVKSDEWLKKLIKQIEEDENKWIELCDDNWWLEDKFFSDYYAYNQNELNSNLNIVLSMFDSNSFGKKLQRTLFEFIILDDIFMCEHIMKQDFGECTANVVGALIKRQDIEAINNILDLIFFNKRVIGEGFVNYFRKNKECIANLKANYDSFNFTVQLTIDIISEVTNSI